MTSVVSDSIKHSV